MKQLSKILCIIITLVLVASMSWATSSRRYPTQYASFSYPSISLATFNTQTAVDLTSVTTTSGDSSGNTLNVVSTAFFVDCTTDGTSTILVDGQTLTITGITSGTELAVSTISGTIATGQAVSCGAVLVCNDSGSPYDDSITLSGATTTANYYRVIEAAAGQEGTPTSGVRFEKTTTSRVAGLIRINEDYSSCYDIAASVNITVNSQISAVFRVDSNQGNSFVGCIAYDSSSAAGSMNGLWAFNLGGTVNVINCVFYNIGNNGIVLQTTTAPGNSTLAIYNCTIINNSIYGINVQASTGYTTIAKVKNCVVQGNTSANINNAGGGGTVTINQTTNATSGVTFATDGYHLSSSDTGAIDQGTDLSSDGIFPFTDDIDFDDRGIDWDIGADQIPTTGFLDLKVVVELNPTENVDLKVRLKDTFSTFYVRPSTYSSGNNDGTSYVDAWQGWDNVNWNSIDDGDTIEDYSGEKFRLDDIHYSSTAKVKIIGHDTTPINGATTINNANWTNYSGNVWRIPVTASDLNYIQSTEPASPSDGEKWFITTNGINNPFTRPNGMAFEWSASKSKWVATQYYDRVNMVFVNGTYTLPVITDGGTVDSYTATSITDASYVRGVDDYWKDCIIWCNTNPWWYHGQIITGSVGATGEIDVPSWNRATFSGSPVSYIIGNINELSSQYEWGYKDGYLYMYFDSDPTGSSTAISYTEGGAAIVLNDCDGLELSGYKIENINDSAILGKDCDDIAVNDCDISDIYCNDFLWYRGAITFNGRDITETDTVNVDNGSYSANITLDNNQISYVYNGHAICLWSVDNADMQYNQCTYIQNLSMPMGSPCGVFLCRGSNEFVQYNFWNYCSYSGFWETFLADSIIDSNVCYHTMDSYSDGGAIYCAAYDKRYSRANIEVTNNKIEFTSDRNAVSGVYFDSAIKDSNAEGNIIYAHHGLTPDTYTITDTIANAAFFEHSSSGTSNNSCINNSIYDDDCGLVYNNSGASWTGTTSGNTRYAESSYAFYQTNLLDLKADLGNYPTNSLGLKANIKDSIANLLDGKVLVLGYPGFNIGGIPGALNIGGVNQPSEIGGVQ